MRKQPKTAWARFSDHCFEKTNLVTKAGRRPYDAYKCSACGLEGKRFGLSDFLSVSENRPCAGAPAPLRVRIASDSVRQFGLQPGEVHDTVRPPAGQGGTWVFSQKRGEPVKLLPYEFEPLEHQPKDIRQPS